MTSPFEPPKPEPEERKLERLVLAYGLQYGVEDDVRARMEHGRASLDGLEYVAWLKEQIETAGRL
jgi:hypothetical protein